MRGRLAEKDTEIHRRQRQRRKTRGKDKENETKRREEKERKDGHTQRKGQSPNAVAVLTVRLVCNTEMWLGDRREADILLSASESHFLLLLLHLPSTLLQMSSLRTVGTQCLVLKK